MTYNNEEDLAAEIAVAMKRMAASDRARKRKDRSKASTAWLNFVATTVVMGFEWFYGALMAMIFLGVAHSFDGRIPTLGYWTVFFLVVTVRAVPLLTSMNQVGGKSRNWTDKS